MGDDSISKASIIRVALGWLVIETACILRSTILVHCSPAIFIWEQFLDLPVTLLSADTEFKIFLRD